MIDVKISRYWVQLWKVLARNRGKRASRNFRGFGLTPPEQNTKLAEHAKVIAQLQQTLSTSERECDELGRRIETADQHQQTAQQRWAKETATLERRLSQLQEERDQFTQQLGDLGQKLSAAELHRAEAEREAEVLSRQLDAFALRLAQSATKSKKAQPRKSTRSR